MNTMQAQQLQKKAPTGPNESGIAGVQQGLGLVGGILAAIPTPATRVIGGIMQGAGTTIGAARSLNKNDTTGAIMQMLGGGSNAMSTVAAARSMANQAQANPRDYANANSRPDYGQALPQGPEVSPMASAPKFEQNDMQLPKMPFMATRSNQFYGR